MTKISLISARIHNSQYLIHSRNNQFDINGTTVTIPIGNYSGDDLAQAVATASLERRKPEAPLIKKDAYQQTRAKSVNQRRRVLKNAWAPSNITPLPSG